METRGEQKRVGEDGDERRAEEGRRVRAHLVGISVGVVILEVVHQFQDVFVAED